MQFINKKFNFPKSNRSQSSVQPSPLNLHPSHFTPHTYRWMPRLNPKLKVEKDFPDSPEIGDSGACPGTNI